jgi:polar amino acid transport system substrate-binding protein
MLAALTIGSCGGASAPTASPPTLLPTPLPAVAVAKPSEIVSAGQLRVGINLGNPVLGTKDASTGELKGITPTLGRALAEQIGVKFVPVESTSIAAMVDAAKAGAWDVGFLAIDPARAVDMDFTAAYMEVDNTYLVPSGSLIATVADADRPGVKVAVPNKSAPDLFLSGALKQAQLVRTDSGNAACDLLIAGKVDAFAADRFFLLGCAKRLPGSIVLADRFLAVQHAIAVPKGHPQLLAYVTDFVEQAKRSGRVKAAIEAAGVAGVQVAPAGP